MPTPFSGDGTQILEGFAPPLCKACAPVARRCAGIAQIGARTGVSIRENRPRNLPFNRAKSTPVRYSLGVLIPGRSPDRPPSMGNAMRLARPTQILLTALWLAIMLPDGAACG